MKRAPRNGVTTPLITSRRFRGQVTNKSQQRYQNSFTPHFRYLRILKFQKNQNRLTKMSKTIEAMALLLHKAKLCKRGNKISKQPRTFSRNQILSSFPKLMEKKREEKKRYGKQITRINHKFVWIAYYLLIMQSKMNYESMSNGKTLWYLIWYMSSQSIYNQCRRCIRCFMQAMM